MACTLILFALEYFSILFTDMKNTDANNTPLDVVLITRPPACLSPLPSPLCPGPSLLPVWPLQPALSSPSAPGPFSKVPFHSQVAAEVALDISLSSELSFCAF